MRKLPGRMVLLAEEKETNSKVTGKTVAVPSAHLTCKTTEMTRDSGGKYGASTETSSTQCNVSNRLDRQVGIVVVYLLTSR